MYGAGDVQEPAVDTVDLMEDFAIEFLADLVSGFVLGASGFTC
jgi:hypothetical protein